MTPAQKAVEFWALQLTRPTDDAAIARLGVMGGSIAKMRDKLLPDAEKLATFRRTLESAIELWIAFGPVKLGTDYEAEGILYDVAKASGVNTRAFPFKTRTVVTPTEFRVNGEPQP